MGRRLVRDGRRISRPADKESPPRARICRGPQALPAKLRAVRQADAPNPRHADSGLISSKQPYSEAREEALRTCGRSAVKAEIRMRVAAIGHRIDRRATGAKRVRQRPFVGVVRNDDPQVRVASKWRRCRFGYTVDAAGPARCRVPDQQRCVSSGAWRMDQDMIDVLQSAAYPFEVSRIAFPDVVDGKLAHPEAVFEEGFEIAGGVDSTRVKHVGPFIQFGPDQAAERLHVSPRRGDAPISPRTRVSRGPIPDRK